MNLFTIVRIGNEEGVFIPIDEYKKVLEGQERMDCVNKNSTYHLSTRPT